MEAGSGHNCGIGRAPGVVFPGRCWRLRFWMFWLVRAVFCRRGAPAVLPHWFGLVEARSEHNCGTGRAPGVVFPGRRWRLRLWMFRMVRAIFCRQEAPAGLPHWVGLVAALQESVWALFAAPVGAILHVNNDRMSRSNSGRTSSCNRSSSNVSVQMSGRLAFQGERGAAEHAPKTGFQLHTHGSVVLQST